jgi:RecB family exonuclease
VTAGRPPVRPAKGSAAARPRRRATPAGKAGGPVPANAMIRFLADFCRGHALDEKVFIVPSYSIGHQIGHCLAGAGEAWINLRLSTLPSLAHKTVALELAEAGTTELSVTELMTEVDGLFRELADEGRLEYFDRLAPKPGVARALYRALQALRLAGLTSRDLDAARFCTPAKGRDTSRLLGRYEEFLEAANGLDLPGLYRLAIAKAEENARRADVAAGEAVWYLCLEDQSLSRLEREFLEAVGGARLVPVPRDPVHGLEPPRLRWTQALRSSAPSASPGSDVDRLPWLFDPRSAPPPAGDASIGMFRAVGPANECREILRRVTASKTPYDDVEVIHPPGAFHPAVFHTLSARTGLPVTFADGIPLALTSPGRVFFGLLDWIEHSFAASDLCRLVEAGDLVFRSPGPAEAPPPLTLGRYLRSSGIGWGRERYPDRLRALEADLQSKMSGPSHGEADDEDGGRTEFLRRSVVDIRRLEEAVGKLLSLIPEIGPSGPVDFPGLCAGLSEAVGGFATIRQGRGARFDEEARDALRSELLRAGGRSGPPRGGIFIGEALERLRTLGSSLAVGASSPVPGHIHVSSFASGGFAGRGVTFVAGLEDACFPGRALQDPVLLDAERERLSASLPTSADTVRTSLYSLAVLLASLRGRVTFSYPSYDIIEERPSFPSSVLLQVHRLVGGNADLDYSSLEEALPEAAGFIPDGPEKTFDETDWWLGRLCRPMPFLDGSAAVGKNFPQLGAGILAVAARAGEKLTAYEGIVTIDRARFDPATNLDLSMSASRLELLAKCPYGYFLRHVLGVEPPDELERDPARWLDPTERGSLIHEILCDFMREVTARKERVDPARHAGLMSDTESRLILAKKSAIPPPSEGIFEKERRDITGALEIFLDIESRRPGTVEPLEFERRFRGVEMPLGGEGEKRRFFLLRGIIDRIDRTGPGTYRVLDYKTGSYVPFENLVGFGQGRIIQHALYAVAAETFLEGEPPDGRPRVTESGYYFPTRRGEGREIMVGPFDRRRLADLLSDLLGLVADGYFIAGPGATCDFCEFAAICGGAPAETKRKADANRAIFEAYEKLKNYD